MDVNSIVFWLRFAVDLIHRIVDGEDVETAAGFDLESAPPVLNMKPERIQFWIGQLARFIAELVDGADEETGKSGESSGASASEEVEW